MTEVCLGGLPEIDFLHGLAQALETKSFDAGG